MIQKTKEALLKYMADERWGLSPQDVVKKLAASKAVMPFQESEWDNYIRILTKQTTCVYCGAPKVLNNDLHAWVCMESKTHYHMLKTELFYIHANRCTPEQARAFFMQECEHGVLKFCCLVCIEANRQKNFEEAKRREAELMQLVESF